MWVYSITMHSDAVRQKAKVTNHRHTKPDRKSKVSVQQKARDSVEYRVEERQKWMGYLHKVAMLLKVGAGQLNVSGQRMDGSDWIYRSCFLRSMQHTQAHQQTQEKGERTRDRESEGMLEIDLLSINTSILPDFWRIPVPVLFFFNLTCTDKTPIYSYLRKV